MAHSSFLQAYTQEHQVSPGVELAWQMGIASLVANKDQIVLNAQVYQAVGRLGVEEIKHRLSRTLGDVPITAFIDTNAQVIRLMASSPIHHKISPTIREPGLGDSPETQDENESGTASMMRHTDKKPKIPRPPNAFILYRQHYHPVIKSQNFTLHNNEISKMLGQKWKDEPQAVRDNYKKLSEELKKKHAAKYPGYQYAPRKPGEKKKRMTSRKIKQMRDARSAQQTPSFSTLNVIDDESISSQDPIEHTRHMLEVVENVGEPKHFEHSTMDLPTLQHQDDDTIALLLPSPNENIQHEVDQSIERYQHDLEDADGQRYDSILAPQSNQLRGIIHKSCIDQANYFESIIDWEGLGLAISSIDEMTDDLECLNAYQNTSPTAQHP